MSLRDSRFRSAIVKIAATIRGVPPEDLESEDVRLHRRARRLARAALATVLVLALAASIAAVLAVANARRAERRARDALARQMGLAALDLPASEVDQAFLLSLVAADLDSGDDAERFQASRALIGRYSRLERLLYAPEGTTSIRDVAIAPSDNRRILAASTGADGGTSVLTWEEAARTDSSPTEMADGIRPAVSFTDGGSALIGEPVGTVVVTGDPGSPERTTPDVVAIDPERGLAATVAPPASLELIDIDGGTVLARSPDEPGAVDLHFGRAVTTSSDRVVLLDTSNGAARSAAGSAAGATVVGAGPSDETAAVTASVDQLVVWRRVGDRLEAGDTAALPDEVGNPRQVAVSPDGARVLVVGAAGSAVVQLAGGAAESVDPEATGIVAVDPSGQFAAVGGARVTIWNLATGRPTFSVPRPVNAMAWSGPCGQEPTLHLSDRWRVGSTPGCRSRAATSSWSTRRTPRPWRSPPTARWWSRRAGVRPLRCGSCARSSTIPAAARSPPRMSPPVRMRSAPPPATATSGR